MSASKSLDAISAAEQTPPEASPETVQASLDAATHVTAKHWALRLLIAFLLIGGGFITLCLLRWNSPD